MYVIVVRASLCPHQLHPITDGEEDDEVDPVRIFVCECVYL